MMDVVASIPDASTTARQIDDAFFIELAIAGTIIIVLCLLLTIFAVRYRSGSRAPRGPMPKLLQKELEIGWTAATIFLAIFLFWWFVGGFQLPPRGAPDQLEVHVVAKQWMWKVEHADGVREINALHIPLGRPIRLVMVSQDAIHSFFVPAFRVKQDVLPVRSTELVFTPTKVGSFHLFCAEFCGTQHSHMTGTVTVMTPADFVAWSQEQPHNELASQRGEVLFAKLGCGGCHWSEVNTAPSLEGLFGSTATLADGRRVAVDEAYLRRAIRAPQEQSVAGYKPVMPSYDAVINTAELEDLVAYLKSLPEAGHE